MTCCCGVCGSHQGQNRAPGAARSPRPGGIPSACPFPWSQLYLLALRSLEVDVAVALPALGRCTELPQPVGLGGLGQADVSEGAGGSRHLRADPIDAYGQSRRKRSCSPAALPAAVRFDSRTTGFGDSPPAVSSVSPRAVTYSARMGRWARPSPPAPRWRTWCRWTTGAAVCG